MKYLVATALTTTALAFGAFGASDARADACNGPVTLADMNWASASVMANVDKLILETAFECEVELVPGDTMPTGTSMIEKGEPDVAPELWSNAMIEPLRAAEAEGRLKFAGNSLSDGGSEGWWVPKYLVEKHPELATVSGVKANPQLFPHPEDDSKSGLYGCPAGWNCQISTVNLAKAMGMEAVGFEVIDPGSAAGLDGSIAKAYERGQGWIGYYWAPTAILGKYEMVKVDYESGIDEEHFTTCITVAECEDPKASMYPPAPVNTITTAAFADRAPEAYAYFTKRAFDNPTMNKVLAWMDDERATGDLAAEHFLMTYEEIWGGWLTPEQVAKVKAAL